MKIYGTRRGGINGLDTNSLPLYVGIFLGNTVRKVYMEIAIFDLEQQMLQFANITDDIELVNRHFTESEKWAGMDAELCDAILNKYGAIQQLYEIKFQRMWNTFEEVCKEYQIARKMAGLERDKELESLFDEKELQETMVVAEVYRNNNNERVCRVDIEGTYDEEAC